jgi:predicted SnoaL-like aldol condensation-catalyzing enzyme
MTLQHDANKERAIQFLELASSGEVDEAYERYASPSGKHHSPHFAAGFIARRAAMQENHRQFPDKRITIKHLIGEDDMVAVHSHVVLEPRDLGVATLHLFRFEDREIVELWDFGQRIQADSANSDGRFRRGSSARPVAR